LIKSHIFATKQTKHTAAERRVLETVDHPFMVKLRYAFQSQLKLYLIMDFYPGGSLYFHLKALPRNTGFSVEQARFYAAELSTALDYLHTEMRCVYRDIKLENILLTASGHIRLTDFGLSKENIHTPANGAVTFCGTAEYIAPEVIKRQEYGTAADWWSFGVLIYEMLTGITPFYNRNKQHMYESIVKAKVMFPRRIPLDARDLLTLHLLQRDPARRLKEWKVLKAHTFFRTIDWDALLREEVAPPFKPTVKSVDDTRNIPSELNRAKGKTKLIDQDPGGGSADNNHPDPQDETYFAGFDYVGPSTH